MEARKKMSANKIILFCLILATLFMSTGYAVVNSVILGIGGNVKAQIEEKIFINDAYYKESTNASEADSEILSIHKTMMNGNIVLSDTEEDSKITYTLEFKNQTFSDYIFMGVTYVDDFYSNDNITFSLSGLEVMDVVKTGETFYVDITFEYADDVTASAEINTLEYYLSFNFVKYMLAETTGDFEYNEGVIEYIVEKDGKYFLQVWGAKGGNAAGVKNGTKLGGAGGYTEGYANLVKGESIFIIIGGAGKDLHQDDYLQEDGKYAYQYTVDGGYNGGGDGYSNVRAYVESPGGGATHMAKKFYGELATYENHKEDILLVAGGGGGANYEGASWNCSPGGAGGGLTSPDVNHGGNGIAYGASTPDETPGNGGSFGQGGNGSDYPTKLLPGGGGGYYGGGFVTKNDGSINSNKGSSGGSGYIGGVENGLSIAGNLEIPTYDGVSTMTGNVGNGHAKITYFEENA